ncbi:hypothetical protein [Veillonella sp.]|uniref:hypothetical protein n=1 Tax=Veillonella TaxID=29465 RepID=UPI0025E9A4EB|nr:hypothetical protein [Veillonella sp.]
MFLRIIKRQIAAHLEHRTVLHQPAIILLSECSLLSQGIKVSGTTGSALNSGYSEGEKLITYPIPFKELLGFTSGLVDTSATFAEHASVNPNNSNARVFLHALTATNVEITTWLWLVGI